MGMTMRLNHQLSQDAHDEIITELAKNIKHSMDQELLYNVCLMSGWKGAIVLYQQLDEVKEWVETNKLGEVRWYDNRLAFEQSKDYEWFILRWA